MQRRVNSLTFFRVATIEWMIYESERITSDVEDTRKRRWETGERLLQVRFYVLPRNMAEKQLQRCPLTSRGEVPDCLCWTFRLDRRHNRFNIGIRGIMRLWTYPSRARSTFQSWLFRYCRFSIDWTIWIMINLPLRLYSLLLEWNLRTALLTPVEMWNNWASSRKSMRRIPIDELYNLETKTHWQKIDSLIQSFQA